MRQNKIIEILKNENSFCSVNYLSSCLDVSTRTIINDIKSLNYIGQKNGFQILLKRSQGYYLDIQNIDLFKEFDNRYGNENQFVDGKKRIEDIAALLLLQNDYITYEELAEYFKISKLTIKRDMNEVQKYLDQECILLDSKAHYGIRIVSRSLHRRIALTNLYEKQNRIIYKTFNQVIFDEFKEVEKELLRLLKEYDLSTNYTELRLLDSFLKVLILTHVQDFYEDRMFQQGEDLFYEIASELSLEIKHQYNIELHAPELDDFSVFLKQHTQRKTIYKQASHKEIKEFISHCVMQLNQEFQLDFHEDPQFLQNLTSHIVMMLDRLHQNIVFQNPMIDKICAQYPLMVNISIRFAEMLEQHYHVKIKQDEIGFIATHFAVYMERISQKQLHLYKRIGVVCSSGGGSAFLIRLKLETLFVDSEAETFSLLEMDELKVFDPDVIFTITDLKENLHVPVIKINEMMDDKEMSRIHQLVKNELHENNIIKIFDEKAFKFIDQSIAYIDLLKEMSQEIEANGYAGKGYSDYVLEREEFLSTIYANGIAIPHPINMVGKKNLISVAVMKTNIEAIKPVHIVFMVSLRKEDLKLQEQITSFLLEIMQSEEKVNDLRNANSYRDFIRRLNVIKGGIT